MLPQRGIEGIAAQASVNQLGSQRASVGFQAFSNGGQTEIHGLRQKERGSDTAIRTFFFLFNRFCGGADSA